MSDPTPHTLAMDRLYGWQAPVFDLTRGPILLGRGLLAGALAPVPAGSCAVEVGCGTGHNLPALQAAVGPEGTVLGIECATALATRAQARCRTLSTSPAPEIRIEEFDAAAPPCDAVVFSYSLSMMPEPDAVLSHVAAALRPKGRLIVLDFAEAPAPGLGWLMARAGVDVPTLGARWAAIRARFDVESEAEHRAYGGLWRYRLLVATRRTAAPPSG